MRGRLAISLVSAGIACSSVMQNQALLSAQGPRRLGETLTLAQRVSYQHAIEEVYWRHRIWPKDNPSPKPALDAVISSEQIEKKVDDYLCKSRRVADYRKYPITDTELQGEIDRMAQHSKQPQVLSELFAALGNDPFVVAECLARPALAERVSANLTGVIGGVSRPMNLVFAGMAGATKDRNRVTKQVHYRLPEIAATECATYTWSPISTMNAPDARIFHTAVWTGSEMIIWGGFNNSPPYFFNIGSMYTPATDNWTATNTINAPAARDFHTAVWTGTEMIIWGGGNNELVNTGGRYDPVTDSWTATSAVNAPTPRVSHSAVWSGIDMVVWGGRNNAAWFNSGGRYNPSTDSWTATSIINAPEARWAHTVEWTGSEMIVWGGTNQTIYLNTGGRYNPTSNSWTATNTANAPLGRIGHTSVWSGSQMIVWGGTDSTFNDTNTGGRYNPTDDTWNPINLTNAPSPRDSLAAVWTGSEMIVWGGVFCCPSTDFNTGGRYGPGTDSWTPTSTLNAPLARSDHKAVWTGNEMIVWGGYNSDTSTYLNTGGRYCAQSGATPTPTATPTSTATPTATITATPRPTPTPRIAPTARSRPTPAPRP